MFNKRNQRVVFAVGVLLVLSLAAFGSMIAVAWMSMNNAMAMTSDAYSVEDCTVEDSVALAWRLDPSTVRIIDVKDAVRMPDAKLDPSTVRIIDIKDAVRVLDAKLDPSTVRIIDIKDAVRMLDAKLDPNTVRIIDIKDEFRALCLGGAHYAFDCVLY